MKIGAYRAWRIGFGVCGRWSLAILSRDESLQLKQKYHQLLVWSRKLDNFEIWSLHFMAFFTAPTLKDLKKLYNHKELGTVTTVFRRISASAAALINFS